MRDMTHGSIAKSLIRFAVPLMLSGILQQLYGWVDALIVGNYIGEEAIAAISSTSPVINLFYILFSGFSVGISVLAAQSYGNGNHDKIRRILASFTVLSAVIGVMIFVCGLFILLPFLRLLGTPDNILQDAFQYSSAIFIAIPFMYLYNVLSAVLRGMGDSLSSLYTILVSSVVNIALDMVCVAVLGMGVLGAAIATVISQLLMTLFIVIYAIRKLPFKVSITGRLVEKTILSEGLSLSLPTMFSTGARSVSKILIQNVTNSFGAQIIAAVSTAYRIDSMVMLPMMHLGSGMATFTGQNAGAGKKERITQGVKAGSKLAALLAVALTIVVVPSGGRMLSLFGIAPGTVAIGQEVLITLAVFYPIFAVRCVLDGYLQGMGDMRFSSGANIASLIVHVLLSYALKDVVGYRVVAVSELISWIVHAIICLFRYKYINRNSLI